MPPDSAADGAVELRGGLRVRCIDTGAGLLHFSPAEREEHVCGVVVCGEPFAFAGNGAAECGKVGGYASAEEAVGNNSDFRFVHSYPNNPHLLDTGHHISLEIPAHIHAAAE